MNVTEKNKKNTSHLVRRGFCPSTVSGRYRLPKLPDQKAQAARVPQGFQLRMFLVVSFRKSWGDWKVRGTRLIFVPSRLFRRVSLAGS